MKTKKTKKTMDPSPAVPKPGMAVTSGIPAAAGRAGRRRPWWTVGMAAVSGGSVAAGGAPAPDPFRRARP